MLPQHCNTHTIPGHLAGVDTAELATAEVGTSGVDTAGVDTAELDAGELGLLVACPSPTTS